GFAVDPRGFLSAGEAGTGVRLVRRRGGGGARRRTDTRRLAVRQRVVALVLPDQRPDRRDRNGTDCDHREGEAIPARKAPPARTGEAFRCRRLRARCDLSWLAGIDARPRPRG